MTWLLLFGGLVGLIVGAEAMVRGASRIAARLGISALVIGLTVVAFGTSSPELAVSINSAAIGQASLAVGNIIGSNIFNILFILGLSALITPLMVSRQFIRLEIPLLLLVSFLIWGFAGNGTLGRLEGGVLILGLAGYTWFLISRTKQTIKREGRSNETTNPPLRGKRWVIDGFLVLGGLGLLVLGSRWLVQSAVILARFWGLSELVIGITIIAAGTSLPEVVTSVIAGLRGERDIAVGNVIGSNLINTLGVLGFAGLIAPDGIGISSAALRFDIPVMIVVTFACLPVFFTRGEISRWEGGLFLGYYLAYTAYLLLAAGQHKALPVFSTVFLYFAVPLTLITLLVLALQAQRSRGGNP